MKHSIFLLAFITPMLGNACPDLTGIFAFPGGSTIEISQIKDVSEVTNYKITIDDGNCAVCHTTEKLKADGLVKHITYGRAQETLQVTCDEDRLKYRRTTEYFNSEGDVEFKEVVHQDYRINYENDLALESVENEVPVSKVVCPRL